MLSLTKTFASGALQKSIYFQTKHGILVHHYRTGAAVKLTPHDVSRKFWLLFAQNVDRFVSLIYVFSLTWQVNRILYEKEFTTDFTESPIKSYDSNQVASNNPLEDRRSEASCLFTNGKPLNRYAINSMFKSQFNHMHRFFIRCIRWTRWPILRANHLQALDALHSS